MLQNVDGIDIQEEIKRCERNIEIVQKNIKEFDEVCAEYFKIKQENNKMSTENNKMSTEFTNLKKKLDYYENIKMPLKNFYDTLSPNIQLGIYDSNNELIINEDNIQICEDVVNKYANTTDYKIYDYGEYMDIVLDV